ncbi:vacuolar membrane-associated protein iml1 [Neocucurbitaria cava]|uniref:Vacuolar membrane-associated protein IML1 n=1 Tax=Neocucurbitaria cava TaxID=798079 RepID=A0A9W8Y736_9PLEO|nr:vacuolar membrane-associated protein iml1 [Neocucurbitaria cava]
MKQARVQKICTLWTHDDNVSRDEVVFNGEKFPELPTAPGSLLQIVPMNSGTAVRDFQSALKSTENDSTPGRSESARKDTGSNSHSRRGRRASLTITIDENGAAIPGGRDIEIEKSYVFVSSFLPTDLKSKHPNLQVSIHEKIAKVFGFRHRMQVILTEADEDKHEAHHVELVFRDEYLARADMWRMAVSELSKRTVYRNQKLLFMGTIKATIKHIYIDGQSVHSGYFSPKTKPIFRSESARYVLFIQMSREMWNFDAEGAGEIMFNKVVGGFLPDLFKRWLKINARHVVTIILFTRMQYDEESLSDRPDDTTSHNHSGPQNGTFRDYYRVVVSDMASGDWIQILNQLKKEFRTFLREVSLVTKSVKQPLEGEKADHESSVSETVIAGQPSSASQGNILEAINLAAAQFAKDYIDRDLVRTGISVIVVTPGTGVFEVDYNMLKLTTDTLIGSGIGIDLVCLSPMPLHSVPLFKYRTPRSISDLAATHNDGRHGSTGNMGREDDKTPRQHEANFGSLSRRSTAQPTDNFMQTPDVLPADRTDDWRFAMPYWIDVSFWSGTSDEVLELTKPRKADKIVKKSRKKGRIFSLRCRLYELQMMGVMENEQGDISIPYLEEDPIYPHQLHSAFEPAQERIQNKTPLLNASTTATGSYSSAGDKDYSDDQLDESRVAYKTWMEIYDDNVFSPLMDRRSAEDQLQVQQRRPSALPSSESPELSRGSYLSSSFHSVRPSFGTTTRPSPDATTFQQLMRERSRDIEPPSPRSSAFRLSASKAPIVRADVLQRQKTSARNSTEADRSSLHQRGGSEDSEDHRKSLRPTMRHSPAPSRGPSPPRQTRLPSISNTSIASPIKSDAKPRPSNWFLRQISFGGKAAAAKPTLGDATIDISQGKVKPAMLTVEKNQKGAIAERLASTRLTTTERPSQPIAIRTASRAGPASAESLSSDQASRSVETVRGLQPGRASVPSHPGSVVKDPGSTFLLAGTRALGDYIGPKPDLSSSGGGKEIPRTLSPTSAIAPWAVLVNPCNPKKNSINSKNQYRRWHHVFPRTLRTGTVKWRSLCSPAAVPLTHEWFPTAGQVATEYNESPYKITQNDDDDVLEAPKSRESLIKELIAFRLSHGFQIVVGSSVAEFSGRQEKSLASILAPEYMSNDGDTVFMSVGNSIHQLVCVAGGEVEVRRYTRKPTTALESSAGIDTPFSYRPYIRTAFEPNYDPRDVVLRPPRKEYNWNFIDTFLAGYHDEFSDILRFWRARFVLIPVEIPTVNRRPLPMLAEDSEEEIRLEGIRKLTQVWQKFRYIPQDERYLQPATLWKQKDPNPLAIEYHTRDPSAVIAAGSDHALSNDADSEFQTSLFSDADKYHTSNIDIKKLAEDLQGEKGIQMLDRRWHWKLHYNCFLGFDLTNWLLSNFKDIETRDEAIALGNEIMNKGLFQHVHKRHQFRDGNFFFQIAAEYRAPRPESRMGWFGMRKADKSVPSTPMSEAPRTSPLISKNVKSRPSTGDSSSSNSDSIEEGEKTPTRAGSPKRQVTLSRVMRYDVDPRKRSYRPEIISLHYDRLHNPDNCYHIRIDWMNVTAKLIEDAIVTWATSVEKYGLKLVEVPIAEVANIVDHHPFRSPYSVKLALQPPEPQPEAVWDSAHLSPQLSRPDKFAYHKALLRKLNFVLDVEAASAFPSDVEVTYSWGNPDYKYTQFIHRSGTLLAQITDDGNFLLLANRLAHNRAKDNSRIRQVDPYEHKKATTDGSQSSRLPSTPAVERANPHRSPFASPLARPVQDSSLLHTALAMQENRQAGTSAIAQHTNPTYQTPEQVKDEVEAFCSNADLLSAFYKDAFRQLPSPSPRILPVLDDKIPSLGLPPAISIREASPASSGWTLSSTLIGRGERGFAGGGVNEMNFGTPSGIAGRRQGSEGSGTSTTGGKRGSIVEELAENLPRRQDSQGSSGSGV